MSWREGFEGKGLTARGEPPWRGMRRGRRGFMVNRGGRGTRPRPYGSTSVQGEHPKLKVVPLMDISDITVEGRCNRGAWSGQVDGASNNTHSPSTYGESSSRKFDSGAWLGRDAPHKSDTNSENGHHGDKASSQLENSCGSSQREGHNARTFSSRRKHLGYGAGRRGRRKRWDEDEYCDSSRQGGNSLDNTRSELDAGGEVPQIKDSSRSNPCHFKNDGDRGRKNPFALIKEAGRDQKLGNTEQPYGKRKERNEKKCYENRNLVLPSSKKDPQTNEENRDKESELPVRNQPLSNNTQKRTQVSKTLSKVHKIVHQATMKERPTAIEGPKTQKMTSNPRETNKNYGTKRKSSKRKSQRSRQSSFSGSTVTDHKRSPLSKPDEFEKRSQVKSCGEVESENEVFTHPRTSEGGGCRNGGTFPDNTPSVKSLTAGIVDHWTDTGNVTSLEGLHFNTNEVDKQKSVATWLLNQSLVNTTDGGNPSKNLDGFHGDDPVTTPSSRPVSTQSSVGSEKSRPESRRKLSLGNRLFMMSIKDVRSNPDPPAHAPVSHVRSSNHSTTGRIRRQSSDTTNSIDRPPPSDITSQSECVVTETTDNEAVSIGTNLHPSLPEGQVYDATLQKKQLSKASTPSDSAAANTESVCDRLCSDMDAVLRITEEGEVNENNADWSNEHVGGESGEIGKADRWNGHHQKDTKKEANPNLMTRAKIECQQASANSDPKEMQQKRHRKNSIDLPSSHGDGQGTSPHKKKKKRRKVEGRTQKLGVTKPGPIECKEEILEDACGRGKPLKRFTPNFHNQTPQLEIRGRTDSQSYPIENPKSNEKHHSNIDKASLASIAEYQCETENWNSEGERENWELEAPCVKGDGRPLCDPLTMEQNGKPGLLTCHLYQNQRKSISYCPPGWENKDEPSEMAGHYVSRSVKTQDTEGRKFHDVAPNQIMPCPVNKKPFDRGENLTQEIELGSLWRGCERQKVLLKDTSSSTSDIYADEFDCRSEPPRLLKVTVGFPPTENWPTEFEEARGEQLSHPPGTCPSGQYSKYYRHVSHSLPQSGEVGHRIDGLAQRNPNQYGRPPPGSPPAHCKNGGPPSLCPSTKDSMSRNMTSRDIHSSARFDNPNLPPRLRKQIEERGQQFRPQQQQQRQQFSPQQQQQRQQFSPQKQQLRQQFSPQKQQQQRQQFSPQQQQQQRQQFSPQKQQQWKEFSQQQQQQWQQFSPQKQQQQRQPFSPQQQQQQRQQFNPQQQQQQWQQFSPQKQQQWQQFSPQQQQQPRLALPPVQSLKHYCGEDWEDESHNLAGIQYSGKRPAQDGRQKLAQGDHQPRDPTHLTIERRQIPQPDEPSTSIVSFDHKRGVPMPGQELMLADGYQTEDTEYQICGTCGHNTSQSFGHPSRPRHLTAMNAPFFGPRMPPNPRPWFMPGPPMYRQYGGRPLQGQPLFDPAGKTAPARFPSTRMPPMDQPFLSHSGDYLSPGEGGMRDTGWNEPKVPDRDRCGSECNTFLPDNAGGGQDGLRLEYGNSNYMRRWENCTLYPPHQNEDEGVQPQTKLSVTPDLNTGQLSPSPNHEAKENRSWSKTTGDCTSLYQSPHSTQSRDYLSTSDGVTWDGPTQSPQAPTDFSPLCTSSLNEGHQNTRQCFPQSESPLSYDRVADQHTYRGAGEDCKPGGSPLSGIRQHKYPLTDGPEETSSLNEPLSYANCQSNTAEFQSEFKEKEPVLHSEFRQDSPVMSSAVMDPKVLRSIRGRTLSPRSRESRKIYSMRSKLCKTKDSDGGRDQGEIDVNQDWDQCPTREREDVQDNPAVNASGVDCEILYEPVFNVDTGTMNVTEEILLRENSVEVPDPHKQPASPQTTFISLPINQTDTVPTGYPRVTEPALEKDTAALFYESHHESETTATNQSGTQQFSDQMSPPPLPPYPVAPLRPVCPMPPPPPPPLPLVSRPFLPRQSSTGDKASPDTADNQTFCSNSPMSFSGQEIEFGQFRTGHPTHAVRSEIVQEGNGEQSPLLTLRNGSRSIVDRSEEVVIPKVPVSKCAIQPEFSSSKFHTDITKSTDEYVAAPSFYSHGISDGNHSSHKTMEDTRNPVTTDKYFMKEKDISHVTGPPSQRESEVSRPQSRGRYVCPGRRQAMAILLDTQCSGIKTGEMTSDPEKTPATINSEDWEEKSHQDIMLKESRAPSGDDFRGANFPSNTDINPNRTAFTGANIDGNGDSNFLPGPVIRSPSSDMSEGGNMRTENELQGSPKAVSPPRSFSTFNGHTSSKPYHLVGISPLPLRRWTCRYEGITSSPEVEDPRLQDHNHSLKLANTMTPGQAENALSLFRAQKEDYFSSGEGVHNEVGGERVKAGVDVRNDKPSNPELCTPLRVNIDQGKAVPGIISPVNPYGADGADEVVLAGSDFHEPTMVVCEASEEVLPHEEKPLAMDFKVPVTPETGVLNDSPKVCVARRQHTVWNEDGEASVTTCSEINFPGDVNTGSGENLSQDDSHVLANWMDLDMTQEDEAASKAEESPKEDPDKSKVRVRQRKQRHSLDGLRFMMPPEKRRHQSPPREESPVDSDSTDTIDWFSHPTTGRNESKENKENKTGSKGVSRRRRDIGASTKPQRRLSHPFGCGGMMAYIGGNSERFSFTPSLCQAPPESPSTTDSESTSPERRRKRPSRWSDVGEADMIKRRFMEKFSNASVAFIDTHCHIDFIFRRAGYRGTYADYRKENFTTFHHMYAGCIAVFCDPRTFRPGGVWWALLQEPGIYGAVGCHPKSATEFDSTAEEFMTNSMLIHPRVKALGEIGLDYSGSFSQHAEVQKNVFARQVKLAVTMNLPIVIHCRDAEQDCIDLLKQLVPKNYPIHRHCFTGTWTEARSWLEEFPRSYIGLTPVITFTGSRASGPREVATNIPLDKLLLETDAPYFVPRGLSKEIMPLSHPGMAVSVAAEVARLQRVDINRVLQNCLQNACSMYGLDIKNF